MAETEKQIKAEFPNVKLLSVVVNVTEEESVNSMVEKAVQEFGSLDYGKSSSLRSRSLLTIFRPQRPTQQVSS